jgi:hypothetical protein
MVPGTAKKITKPYVCSDLCELEGIPDTAISVWIILLRQWRVVDGDWVTLPKRIRQTIDLSRQKAGRKLLVLEKHGFVDLRKEPGRSTRILRLN